MKKYLISLAVLGSAALVPLSFADTTGTGLTGTGTNCITDTGMQVDMIAAQQTFSIEIARLQVEKTRIYTLAVHAATQEFKTKTIKAANAEFRAGFQKALKTLRLAKKDAKLHHIDANICKKEKR